MNNPRSWYEQQQRELDAARVRAAQTAKQLQNAPRAQYPGQAPNLAPAEAAADATTAQLKSAPRAQYPTLPPAQAKPAAPPAAPQAQPAGKPGQSDTPGIDAVLAVTRRSAGRAEGYAADARAQAAQAEARRKQLRGELMMQSMKLANPGATSLELDMARRKAAQ